MRTYISLGAGAVTLFAMLLIAHAAPLAKPINVTVTKNDGTSLKAQLTDADPKQIIVAPLVKGQPSGEKQTIPWSDVKSLSNGLTQKKIIEVWKKEHPEDLCTVCQGEGKMPCPTCKGTGRLAASAKDCPTCHGAQTVACKTPKCDHGTIPCPKPHIKLSEGTWVMHSDGHRWRTFPEGYQISEGHLGQITEPKSGHWEPHECPLCHGKEKIIDPKCHGSGVIPCPTCSTAATKGDKCADCDHGKLDCKACEGSGLALIGPGPAATQPAPPPQ